jgi:DNA-binding transcriptional ArsR family regulator
VLRDAGLVSVRRDGRRRLYRARREQLGPLRAVLEDLWRSGLEELRTLAEAEERSARG